MCKTKGTIHRDITFYNVNTLNSPCNRFTSLTNIQHFSYTRFLQPLIKLLLFVSYVLGAVFHLHSIDVNPQGAWIHHKKPHTKNLTSKFEVGWFYYQPYLLKCFVHAKKNDCQIYNFQTTLLHLLKKFATRK